MFTKEELKILEQVLMSVKINGKEWETVAFPLIQKVRGYIKDKVDKKE